MGTFNVLDASLKNNVSQVVITSTSEVYGSAQYIPINEKHPLNAQSPYAASKIGADQLALSYNKSFALPLTILRPFNTFGPRQSARAIIPSIISQIKKNNNLVKIGNSTPTRDFTFVDDTVLAFIRTISNKKAFGEIINIGNNFEISIGDILKIFKNEFNYKFKIKIDKMRIRNKDSEVNRLYSSNIKAKKLLNWEPTYNGRDGFITGLKKTIEWFQNPNNLKFYNSEIYNI